MTAPASGPDSHRPRRTPKGTIVGMPPVVRMDRQAITLRMHAADVGPSSDAFHPERWSNPPPVGLHPIVPFDEPEEDEAVQVRVSPRERAIEAPAPDERPAPAVVQVERRGTAAEESPRAVFVTDEPIVLPYRDRDDGPGSRMLIRAAIVSAMVIASLVAAVLIWS